MTAFTPSLFRTIRRYAGKIQTMRDDIRTRRLLNALPAQHPQGYWLAGSIHRSPLRPRLRFRLSRRRIFRDRRMKLTMRRSRHLGRSQHA